MKSLRLILPVALATATLVGCASDEADDDIDAPEDVVDAPLTTIDDGIQTEVEQGENLGFEGDES